MTSSPSQIFSAMLLIILASPLENGKRRLARDERELYPTDSFPQKYTYEVNLYIEIDKKIKGFTWRPCSRLGLCERLDHGSIHNL